MLTRALRFTENLAVVSLLVASSAALHLAVARSRRRSRRGLSAGAPARLPWAIPT
jgi:hypothetical protein